MNNQWKDVPTLVSELVKEGSTMFARLRAAMKGLPAAMPGYGKVWFNPRTQIVYFTLGDSDSNDLYSDWKDALKVKGVKDVIGEAETPPSKDKGPWLHVKRAAIQDILGPIAQAGGWKSGPVASMLGGPSPLSATIASGVLGAGAGYGMGALAESVLPERYFEKGKLRRTLGLAGGLAGALPGFWTGTVNWRHGTGYTDPIGSASPEVEANESSPGVMGYKTAAAIRSLGDMLDLFTHPDEHTRRDTAKLAEAFDRVRFEKQAYGDMWYADSIPNASGDGPQPIEKDEFNRAVWKDLNIKPEIKGMTSGVLEGASQIGGDTDVVTPYDIARLGVGMGTGWASGMIVGKTLGALAGLKPEVQQSLQRAGVFAGLISNVVPMLFR